jgi:hypothetical protein
MAPAEPHCAAAARWQQLADKPMRRPDPDTLSTAMMSAEQHYG